MNTQPHNLLESTPHQARRGDFRLLALRYRESQADLIRHALKRRVHRARSIDSMDVDALTDEIALVVTAGYRLLDPRRRMDRFERLNLSFAADEFPNTAWMKRSRPLLNTAQDRGDQPESSGTTGSTIRSGDTIHQFHSDPSLDELRSVLAIVKSKSPMPAVQAV